MKKNNSGPVGLFNKPKPEAAVSGPTEPVDVAKRLKTWFPDLEEAICGKAASFCDEILKFNKTINLISPNTVKNADSIHIADSIFAARITEKAAVPGEPIYDFGSGNGCPGLVYAIVYPSRKVILVDRDQRKMEFCKHAGALLKLSNLTIIQNGVEDLPNGSVKNAIARGFAPFSKALLLCRKTFPKGGKFFHMKSDGWANELAAMPSQVFSHWSPSLVGQYQLPDIKSEMFVILTEKTSD